MGRIDITLSERGDSPDNKSIDVVVKASSDAIKNLHISIDTSPEYSDLVKNPEVEQKVLEGLETEVNQALTAQSKTEVPSKQSALKRFFGFMGSLIERSIVVTIVEIGKHLGGGGQV